MGKNLNGQINLNIFLPGSQILEHWTKALKNFRQKRVNDKDVVTVERAYLQNLDPS